MEQLEWQMLPYRIGCIALSACLTGAGLRATEQPQEDVRRSVLQITEPVEAPGTVLKPGSYVFRLRTKPLPQYVSQILDLVEVLDARESRVIAKLYALPDYNPPANKPLFTYYERTPGGAKALSTWFHPAVEYGEQFVYPAEQAAELATSAHKVVLTTPLATTPSRPLRTELPKGAGYLPIAAWLGLAALAAVFVFRIYRRDPADGLYTQNRALARRVAAAAYLSYKLGRRNSVEQKP